MEKEQLKETTVLALMDLAVDLFAIDAIDYALADSVYGHVLQGVEETYGREARVKVESTFVRRAAQALRKELRTEER